MVNVSMPSVKDSRNYLLWVCAYFNLIVFSHNIIIFRYAPVCSMLIVEIIRMCIYIVLCDRREIFHKGFIYLHMLRVLKSIFMYQSPQSASSLGWSLFSVSFLFFSLRKSTILFFHT